MHCFTGAKMNTNLNRQFLIAACLYIGQMMFGYSIGWSAPVLPKLQDPDQTPLESVITDGQASWIGSVTYIGSIPGPWLSGYLSKAIGRKPSLFTGGIAVMLGYMIMGLAKQLIAIYIGRVITGIGISMIFVTNLVYLGEMAMMGTNVWSLVLAPIGMIDTPLERSTNIRGLMLTLTGFFNTLGTLVIYSVGPFISYAATCWLAVAITGVYLIGLYFIVPETPVYQILKGKKEEAMANLTALGRIDDLDNVLAAASEKPQSNAVQMTEIFSIKANRKAFFLITVLNILQQMSGVIVVLLFVTSIFDQTGLSLPSHISTIIIGVTQVVAGSVAPLFVENAGRKLLLLISTAICTLSLAALGIYFHLFNADHPAADSLQWLSLTSLMLFVIGYYSGFGIIPNTFIGEMFTSNVRSFGSSLTVTIGWTFGLGVSTAFGYMLPAWGAAATFWIYSGACATAFLISVVFVPETKGKSLLEIQEMLSK